MALFFKKIQEVTEQVGNKIHTQSLENAFQKNLQKATNDDPYFPLAKNLQEIVDYAITHRRSNVILKTVWENLSLKDTKWRRTLKNLQLLEHLIRTDINQFNTDAYAQMKIITELKSYKLSNDELDVAITIQEKAKTIDNLLRKIPDWTDVSGSTNDKDQEHCLRVHSFNQKVGDVQELWVPLSDDLYQVNKIPAFAIGGSLHLEQIYCYNPEKSMVSAGMKEPALDSKKVHQSLGFNLDAVNDYFELESQVEIEAEKSQAVKETFPTGQEEVEAKTLTPSQINLLDFEEKNDLPSSKDIYEFEENLLQNKRTETMTIDDFIEKIIQSKADSKPHLIDMSESCQDYKFMID